MLHQLAEQIAVTDAIVIGAGPNGLAAAIRLAEAGRSVLVLEAADRPGGAVRTEELTLPGFHHDTFSSVYPAAVASPVFARMPLEDGSNGCTRTPATRIRCRTARRRCCTATAPRCPAATASAGWSSARRSWTASTRCATRCCPASRRSAARCGSVRSCWSRWRGCCPAPAVGLGKRLFEHGASRAWLYGAAMHGDTPPDGAGSAIAAFYLNLLGHAVGWPSPRGGAERLIDALVSYLTSLGGEVRHRRTRRARAERRRARHRRRLGRRAVGGEDRRRRRHARRAAADGRSPVLVQHGAEDLRPRGGHGQGRLGAGRPDPVGERRTVGGAGTVHVAGTEEEFLRSVKQAHDGPADAPFLLLGQQTVADPTRAPEGKHTAWAYTHGPQDAPWTDGIVERIEAQVERFAPGFGERILGRHVLLPGRSRGAQREPRRRRRRRRQLPAAPGRVPAAAEALAVLDAAEGPLPRQRRDVPGRRGPRRPG